MASLLAAVALAGCGSAPTAAAATPSVGARAGDIAPPLTGTSLQGQRLSLDAWRGSVVVLVFWASWCVPCQAEQPAVNALAQQELGAGVHFAGISVDSSSAAARQYMAHYAVPYDSLIDSADTIVVSYEVVGPPTTFVIDREGRVSALIEGQLNPGDLRAKIAVARSAA
jgi:peroxiredoxin